MILFPSCPQDAYDLLIEAAALPDPVLFLEHIGMYGLRGGKTGWGDSINQIVDTKPVLARLDTGEGPTEIGKARIVRGGRDVTIVTWGAMVHVARHAAEIAAEGIEVENRFKNDTFRCQYMYRFRKQNWTTSRSTRGSVDWWVCPHSI